MDSVSLTSVLNLHGKNYVVALTSSHITWHQEEHKEQKLVQKKGKAACKVLLEEIVAVSYEHDFERNKKKGKINEIELFPNNYFSISYISRTRNHRWKCKKSLFHSSEASICQKWVESIRNILTGFNRPKKLLIFINPVGGRKQASKIFQEKVNPLFLLAGIKQDVIVTERANHAQDYLMTNDLSDYDGVVAVGGDGMFSEVLNGILSNRPPPQTDNDVVGPSIKLGLIPAGSTDTIVFCTSGINDPVTSALHIIVGDQLSLDVCSVWHDGKFLKYSVSLMGYGFFGDVIRNSEQLRWLGPRRYDLAGFRSFMENRSYNGEVNYLPVAINPLQRQICTAGCERCAEKNTTPSSDPESWKTARGQFISIIGANITCRCAKSLDGISPNAHLGDGLFDLILIRKTSRLQYLRHMIRVANRGDPFGFDFINVIRVKEFKFRPLPSSTDPADNLKSEDASSSDCDVDSLALNDVLRSPESSTRRAIEGVWNIDGELVDKSNLHVKNHRKLIKIFARGIEVNGERTACRSCKTDSFIEG